MHMGDVMRCVLLVPPYLKELRRRVFKEMMEEMGQDVANVSCDAPPHGFYRHVDDICWKNQTPEVTKMLLDLFRRFIKHDDKKAKTGTRKLIHFFVSYVQYKKTERWAQGRSDAKDIRGWEEMKSDHKSTTTCA